MKLRNKNTGEVMDAAPIGAAGLGAYLAGDWEIANGDLSDLTNDPKVLKGGTQGRIDSFRQGEPSLRNTGGLQLNQSQSTQAQDGTVQVLMPDGTKRGFAIETPEIVAAFQAGGRMIDFDGQPMQMVDDFYGGWTGIGSDGVPLPMNVVAGNGWLPGQEQLVGSVIQSGWKPGGKLPPMPAEVAKLYPELGQQYGIANQVQGDVQDFELQPDGSYGPTTGQPGAQPGTFGDLAEGFKEPFNYYHGNLLEQFRYPNVKPFKFGPEDYEKSPDFDFVMNEGLKAVQGVRSAKGMLKGGGTLKGLTDFARDLQSQDYGISRDRALQEYTMRDDKALEQYGLDRGLESELYGRAAGEYATRFDIDRANKNDVYNRYAGLSGTGMTAGVQQGQLGNNFATRTGNTITDQGTANAFGRIGAANARTTGTTRTLRDIGDYYSLRRTGT